MLVASNLPLSARLGAKLGIGALVLAALAGCEMSQGSLVRNGQQQLALNGNGLPYSSLMTDVSANTLPQVPHSGCPVDIKVKYHNPAGDETRVYHGATAGVGICDVTITDRTGTREARTIMGLWSHNNVLDHINDNAPSMLNIIQGKNASDYFKGYFKNVVSVYFPCEPLKTQEYNLKEFLVRSCSFKDTSLSGRLLDVFDTNFAQNPDDPETWIPLGAQPSAKFGASPSFQSTWTAYSIEFLNRPSPRNPEMASVQ